MTSTNDGKDLITNQTSGPKGKTFFIELYKFLEARLSEGGDASERTKHLCEAWRRVHSLCLHSAPSTHTHLLAWLQRHTSRAVLQTEWQTPKRKNDRESLEEAINYFVAECSEAKAARNGCSAPWEVQLVARGEWFKRVLEHPWDHPVLTLLLNPNGTPPTDDEVLEWLKEERGVTFVMRLHTLVGEKCDDIAMSLATAVMERVRAALPPVTDKDEPIDPPPESAELTFGDRLKQEAGFTTDVWETLTDIEFVLLHKRDSNRCITLAKLTPLSGAYHLIERLQKRLEISPREKRLWKNAKEVAVVIAQVVIARCMMVASCAGAARAALYCCVRLLAQLLPAARLPPAADALANQAPTSRHLHTLAAAVDKQLSPNNEDIKPYICELYVRAITAGMNELERLKLKTEKETEARAMEKTLASWFVQLGDVLSRSDRVLCECTLTAFSLHPSPNMYQLLDAAPQPAPQAKDSDESKEETIKSEFGSWANDSRSQTNFVKTSETLNLKQTQNQANVLSTAIFNEGEALGLSAELCQDIAVLLSGPRVKTLSWDMDRSLLLEHCRAYMKRTHGGTRAPTRELKYLNIDPAHYTHLPEELDDDENDPHYGIERGYEHLVPEEIWEDAEILEGTETASSCHEDEFIAPLRKKKTKRVPLSSDEDSDPLSFMAEAKRVQKKKERPHSKERSKERAKKKQEPPNNKIQELPNNEIQEQERDPLDISGTTNQEKDKPKEKKERKKKEKTPKAKPVKSLTNLVGLKVVEPKKKIIKDIITVTTISPVADSDYKSQGKNSLASFNSESNKHNAPYGGSLSMEQLRSIQRNNTLGLNRMELMKKEFGIASSSKGVKITHRNFLERSPSNLNRMTYRPPTPKTQHSNANRQSPSNPTRNSSPILKTVPDDIRASIAKLLDYRRKAAMNDTAQSPQRKSAITRPNTPIQTNVSPKAVAIPEIPKSYINKQYADKISELKREMDNLLAWKNKDSLKKAEAAVPSAVIQFAKKSNVNKTVTNKSRSGNQQPTMNTLKMSDPADVPYDRLMAEIAERQDLHRGNYNIVKSPHVPYPTTQSIPVQRSMNAVTPGQRDYQNFLKEYDHKNIVPIAHALDMSSKKPHKDSRKDYRSDSRLSQAVPSVNTKAESKTPQSAKQTQQKKPEISLNTFSRLSYMHKNKQTEMKSKNSPQQPIFTSTTYHEVSSELDEIIKEHQRQQMRVIQAKNERFNKLLEKKTNNNTQESIQNTAGAKSRVHPLLSNLLQSPSSHFTKQIQKPLSPPKTSLSEKDQNELLQLLRQQNKLNTPSHHTTNINSKPSTSSTSNDVSNVTSPMTNYNSTSYQKQPSKPESCQSTLETKIINIISNTLLKQAHDAEKCFNDKSKSPILTIKSIKAPDSPDQIKKLEVSKGVAKNNPVTYIPESEKPEWQAVMCDILKHKTPSRGPNALDVALNKSSFELAFEKSLQEPATIFAQKATSIKSENVEQHGKTYHSKLEAISAHDVTILSNKGLKIQAASTKQPIGSSDQKENSNLKKNYSLINEKLLKQNPPVITKKLSQEVQRKQFIYAGPKHDDPFISGIPNSDYDLLEELMDDDLRKEIGELSSDDESYNAAAQSFLKSNKGNEKRVSVEYNKPLNDMAANKPMVVTQCLNARQPVTETPVTQKPVNKTTHRSNTIKVSKKAANNKKQDNTSLVTSTTRTISPHIPTTHKRENQICNNVNILTNNQVAIDPNIYISAVPQQAPLQNVVLIGSQLVYEGYSSVQPPVHPNNNIAPISYMNNTPNITLYQTAQFVAPVANTLIIDNSMTIPIINNIPCAAIPVQPNVVPTYSASNVELQTQPERHVGIETCNTNAEINNPMSETDCLLQDSKLLDGNKTCERKVLSEVQELALTEKTDKAWTHKIEYDMKDASVNQERLKNKRMAIINRKMSYRCGDTPIPLTYAPLPQNAEIVSKEHSFTLLHSEEEKQKSPDHEENKLQDISDAINKMQSPATPDSKESKENNSYPTVNCRRILLRSSNKITSKAKAETVVLETTSKKSKVKLKPNIPETTKKMGDTSGQNDEDGKEATTHKRASKRLRNKTLTITKDEEKTSIKNQLRSKPNSWAKVPPKNKFSKLKDNTEKSNLYNVINDMKFFDFEAELLASKISANVSGKIEETDSNEPTNHEEFTDIPAAGEAKHITPKVSLRRKTENVSEQIGDKKINEVAVDVVVNSANCSLLVNDEILKTTNGKSDNHLENKTIKNINEVTKEIIENHVSEELTPSEKDKSRKYTNMNDNTEKLTEKAAFGELHENLITQNKESKLLTDAEDVKLIQVSATTKKVFGSKGTIKQPDIKVESSEVTNNITTELDDQTTSEVTANIKTASNDQITSASDNITTAFCDQNTPEATADITTAVNDENISEVTANMTTVDNDQNISEDTRTITTALNDQNTSEVTADITTGVNDQNISDATRTITTAFNDLNTPEVTANTIEVYDQTLSTIITNVTTAVNGQNTICGIAGNIITTAGIEENTSEATANITTDQNAENLSEKENIDLDMQVTCEEVKVSKMASVVTIISARNKPKNVNDDLTSEVIDCNKSLAPISSDIQMSEITENVVDNKDIESVQKSMDALSKDQERNSNQLVEKNVDSPTITKITANMDDDVVLIDDDSNLTPENLNPKHGIAASQKIANTDGSGNTDVNEVAEIPQSYKDNISINVMPSDDPLKKVARVTLPNGRKFIATVRGDVHVTSDTLFAYPSIKSAILTRLSAGNLCTLNVKQITTVARNYQNIILSAKIQDVKRKLEDPVETIDLLSDDDDDLRSQIINEEIQTFETEYGKYKISSIDNGTFSRHQNKFSQKARIYLKKCDLKPKNHTKMSINGRIDQSNISPLVPEKYIIGLINDIENKLNSEIIKTSSEIPDIIEIDDSSNDSLDHGRSIENIQPDKINKLKNVLLKELGVKQKSPTTDFFPQQDIKESKNSCDVKEIDSITSDTSQASEMPKLSVVSTDAVCPIDMSEKKEQMKIMNKKCFVKLARCDYLVKMIENKDMDSMDIMSAEALHYEPITITEDFSILDDLDAKIVESEAGSNSSVIELSDVLISLDNTTVKRADVIASLDNTSVTYKESALHEVISLSCEAIWFSTKPTLHLQSVDKSVLVQHNISSQNNKEIDGDYTSCVCKAEWYTSKPTLQLESVDNTVSVQHKISGQNDKKTISETSTPCVCNANWFSTKPSLHSRSLNDLLVQLNISGHDKKEINTENTIPCAIHEIPSEAVLLQTKCTPSLMSLVLKIIQDINIIYQHRPFCDVATHSIVSSLKRKSSSLGTPSASKVSKLSNEITETKLINCSLASTVILDSSSTDITNVATSKFEDTNMTCDLEISLDNKFIDTVKSLTGTDHKKIDEAAGAACDDNHNFNLRNKDEEYYFEMDSCESQNNIKETTKDSSEASHRVDYKMEIENIIEENVTKDIDSFNKNQVTLQTSEIKIISDKDNKTAKHTSREPRSSSPVTESPHNMPAVYGTKRISNASMPSPKMEITNTSSACDNDSHTPSPTVYMKKLSQESILMDIDYSNISKTVSLEMESEKVEELEKEDITAAKDSCVTLTRMKETDNHNHNSSLEVDVTNTCCIRGITIQSQAIENDKINVDNNCDDIEIKLAKITDDQEIENNKVNVENNRDDMEIKLAKIVGEYLMGVFTEKQTQHNDHLVEAFVAINQEERLEIDNKEKEPVISIKTILDQECLTNEQQNIECNVSDGEQYVNYGKTHDSNVLLEENPSENATIIIDHEFVTSLNGISMSDRINEASDEELQEVYVFAHDGVFPSEDDSTKKLEDVNHDEIVNQISCHQDRSKIENDKMETNHLINYEKVPTTVNIDCSRHDDLDVVEKDSKKEESFKDSDEKSNVSIKKISYEEKATIISPDVETETEATIVNDCPCQAAVYDDKTDKLVVVVLEKDYKKQAPKDSIEKSEVLIKNIDNKQKTAVNSTDLREESETTVDRDCSSPMNDFDNQTDNLDVELIKKEPIKDYIEDYEMPIKKIGNEQKDSAISTEMRAEAEITTNNDYCQLVEYFDNQTDNLNVVVEKDDKKEPFEDYVEEFKVSVKSFSNEHKDSAFTPEVRAEAETTIDKDYCQQVEYLESLDVVVEKDNKKEPFKDYVDECEVSSKNIDNKQKDSVTCTEVKAQVEYFENQPDHLDVVILETENTKEEPLNDYVEECEVSSKNIDNEQKDEVTSTEVRAEVERTIDHDYYQQVEYLKNQPDHLDVVIFETENTKEEPFKDYVEECEVSSKNIDNEQKDEVTSTEVRAEVATTIDHDYYQQVEYLENQPDHLDVVILETENSKEEPLKDYVEECEVSCKNIDNKQKNSVTCTKVRAEPETTIDDDYFLQMEYFENQTDHLGVDILLENDNKKEEFCKDSIEECEVSINFGIEEKPVITSSNVNAEDIVSKYLTLIENGSDVLEGIVEYEDPTRGTCYVVPIIDKTLNTEEVTSGVLQDLREIKADMTNIGTANELSQPSPSMEVNKSVNEVYDNIEVKLAKIFGEPLDDDVEKQSENKSLEKQNIEDKSADTEVSFDAKYKYSVEVTAISESEINDEDYVIYKSDKESLVESDDKECCSYVYNEAVTENLKVIVPKHTYARGSEHISLRWKNLKRKMDMSDVKIQEKKYRKGKNIDYPKITASAISETAYSKEYKRLFDYCSSVKFSYAVPFHKDYIDVHSLLGTWPIKNCVPVGLVDTTEMREALFTEVEKSEVVLDPLEQTLSDEIINDYDKKNYKPSNIDETNFKMGFGEGSGRVIQKLKDGEYTTFSAATLSDVKQLQPLLPSDEQEALLKRQNCNGNENQDQKLIMMRFIDHMKMREKVRSFFKKTQAELTWNWQQSNKKDDCENTNEFSNWPFDLTSSRCIQPPPVDITVNVVQVGQLPVSAAAQNPVTCDPRVTHVSNVSPSQCSPENSSGDDIQTTIKTEYTELTTADITLPLMQEYVHHHHSIPTESQQPPNLYGADDTMSMATEIKTVVKIEFMEETSQEKLDENVVYDNNSAHQLLNGNVNNDVQYHIDNIAHNITVEPDTNVQAVTNSLEKPKTAVSFSEDTQHNETLNKSDQISHTMNVPSVTAARRICKTNSVDALAEHTQSQNSQSNVTPSQSTNNFTKSTPINAIALQQALAQILPPVNQPNTSENNQQTSTNPQVLHIVQANNAQSVINKTNGTQLLHIVQNKSGANTKATPAAQPSSFSGLSLVDGSIQQNGNQILHIVNTGNQKSSNAGQLLKRVNLLTSLANVPGSNEQKMVQFVCKSADGKTIQLPQQQRGMVLRLHPLESSNVPATPKQNEAQESCLSPSSGNSHSINEKEPTPQEMKSRSLYEENYAKFVQNGDSKPVQEKATSLPKFNQVFGKQGYQEKQNEMVAENLAENAECPPDDNNVQLEQINDIDSPPMLSRKPTQSPHVQPNLAQQIKQTIGPMNIQTMHGGVIYTRQIPVNIGGGQTINLITVPSTELVDETAQKQQTDAKFGNQEGDPPIIKIVPTNPAPSSNGPTEDNNVQMGSSNEANTQTNPQPQLQPVLTQMRIKLPMLSKAPQMVGGTRVVRPSFFQIQRNVIGGANQQVYQQLVLTATPSLGQSVRVPAQTQKPKPASETQSSPESQMSSSTLEQLREFDMVLEQVKERSTVQPGSSVSSNFTKSNTSADTTDSSPPNTSTQETPTQVLYSVGNTQPLNMVSYANRKSTITSTATSSYERSPDSSAAIESPSSSTHAHLPQTVTSEPCASSSSCASEAAATTVQPKTKKKKPKPSTSTSNPFNIKNTPKPSSQKPLEDEQTTQRILYILAEYKEQVENSPDKDKPAPRRRNNPAAPGAGSSKRKKSSSGSRKRDTSPVQGEDSCRTMGSEDSSCGTSMGECNECLETQSPEESPRKVVRRLTFEQETHITQTRTIPQRNVIVTDGQAFAVRGAPGKSAATVLMPANYLLPVSMVKGGQQIAIVTNRGPKLLVGAGEGGAGGTLLFQRLIGPAGLKPMLARPGVRHIRLPTAALHNLQAFNIATPAAAAPPPDSTASAAPAPAPPDLVDTRAMSSPWPDRDAGKPDRGNSSPEGSEPWNLPSSSIADDYGYEEIVRTDNMDRTVLDAIPDRYSPDMEAQRIFDKMFDVDSKKSMYDSRCGYDIDASDDDKAYHQVVQRKDGRHTRLTHVSAAALRHKCAILEQELRLQKSLSEECEDLGVDSPSASDLFPEAELLFAPSPAHEQTIDPCHTPQPTILQGIPQPDLDDQTATDHLLSNDRHDELDINLDDVGEIVTVGEDGMTTIPLDHEEFARSHEEFARSHPNTTFHTEPEDGEIPPFTIAQGIKGRQITFHTRAVPGTVVMAPQTTVISQATVEPTQNTVKFTDIDNMLNAMPSPQRQQNNNPASVNNESLSKFDRLLNESRELHASNASAVVHSTGNGTQVIRRLHYETRRDARYVIDDPHMTGERQNDRRNVSIDNDTSPERHPELFWDTTPERRRFDLSSDSDKCSKSSYDEPVSDPIGVGAHTRLDSVIKAARTERRRSDASDEYHPPLRTYPPKRPHHHMPEIDRSLQRNLKARASERCDGKDESRRRASNRGVVKRGCHCCNGSAPPKPKKSRPKKNSDFSS